MKNHAVRKEEKKSEDGEAQEKKEDEKRSPQKEGEVVFVGTGPEARPDEGRQPDRRAPRPGVAGLLRKTLFFLTIGLLALLVVRNLGAVTDIYSGRRGLRFGEVLFAKARPSTPLARSLAHYTMGIIYDNELRGEEAIRRYEAALGYTPDVAYIRTRLAVDYFLTKRIDKAFAELAIAKSLDPADPKPHFLAALIYTSLGRFEDAQKEYQEITRIAPDSLWALSSLADVLVLQQKMSEAAAIYEQLIEKEQSSDILYFNLGVIYARMGKFDEAIRALDEAVKLNPDYDEAYVGLALLYQMKGDLPRAIRNFEKVLEFDPVNAQVYHQLGYLYYRQKDYAAAERQYETLIGLDPADAFAYIEWANIYLSRKLADRAIAVLERARAAGVEHPGVYLALGYAHSLKDDAAAELTFYNMAQELAPDEPRVHFYLGAYYEKLGQQETAVRELRKAIELDEDFADAYNYLGYMFAEEGKNLDEAVELIQKAVALDPENGAYIDSLGWAYFKQGRVDEALAELERAVVLEPDDAVVRDHLGDVYFEKGLRDKAAAAWRESLKLDPKQETVRQKLKDVR